MDKTTATLAWAGLLVFSLAYATRAERGEDASGRFRIVQVQFKEAAVSEDGLTTETVNVPFKLDTATGRTWSFVSWQAMQNGVKMEKEGWEELSDKAVLKPVKKGDDDDGR